MEVSLTIQPGRFVLNAVRGAAPATEAIASADGGTLPKVETVNRAFSNGGLYRVTERRTARSAAATLLQQAGESP
jgi:hypothetical protein